MNCGPEDVKAAGLTHPGFSIMCQKCKCYAVVVHINFGFSGVSGSWGGVHLVCGNENCEATTTIMGN